MSKYVNDQFNIKENTGISYRQHFSNGAKTRTQKLRRDGYRNISYFLGQARLNWTV